jgi:putative ABC transport system permease protein
VKGAWRLAARNLRRNRRRNVATGLAIAFGFAGLAVLAGYISRVDSFLRTTSVYLQHSGHVVVYHADGLDKAIAKPARYSLTPEEQAAIRKAAANDPRIDLVTGYLKGMGLVSNGCRSVPFIAIGMDPEAQRRILTTLAVSTFSGDFGKTVRGRHLYEYPGRDDAIGLAFGLATLLGKKRVHDDFPSPVPLVPLPDCSAGNAAASFAADANVQLAGVTVDGSITAIDAEVVNIFHTPTTEADDQVIHAKLPALQRLYDTDAVTCMAVFLKDDRDAKRVAADLRRKLSGAGVPVDIYDFTDERVNPYYAGSMDFLYSMAFFILLIVSTVVVLGVMNSTTLTVYERSREFGTLRAVGYTRSQVTGLVVRELALLAALGVAGGFAGAHAAAAAVRLAGVRISPPGVPGTMQVIVTPPTMLSIALAILLSLLSLAVGWVVARRRLSERTSDLLIAVSA